jgi:hypothetical protein
LDTAVAECDRVTARLNTLPLEPTADSGSDLTDEEDFWGNNDEGEESDHEPEGEEEPIIQEVLNLSVEENPPAPPAQE